MALVAFEDAATWCETLADLTDEWIGTARERKPASAALLQRAVEQVAETRRYLESNRREMTRLRARVGLP